MTTRTIASLITSCVVAACSTPVDEPDAISVQVRRGAGAVAGARVVFHDGDTATIETTAADGIARGLGDAITIADPFPIALADSYVDVLTVVDLDPTDVVTIDLGSDRLDPRPRITVDGVLPGADYYTAESGCPGNFRSIEEGVNPWCGAAGATDVIAVAHGASPGKLLPPTRIAYAAIADVALDDDGDGTATVAAWSTACTGIPVVASSPPGTPAPTVTSEWVWRGRAFAPVCPTDAGFTGLPRPSDVPVDGFLVAGHVIGASAVSLVERREPADIAEVQIDGTTDLFPPDLVAGAFDRADPRRPVVGWTAGADIATTADASIVTMVWDVPGIVTRHMQWRVLGAADRAGVAFPALPADFAAYAPDPSSAYLGWNVRYVDAGSIAGWAAFRGSTLPMSANAAGDPLAWPDGMRLRTLRSPTIYEP